MLQAPGGVIPLHYKSLLLTAVSSQIDDFQARSPDELSLARGDRIELIERDDDFGDGWYLGKHLQNARTGLFPEGMWNRCRWSLAL